MNRFITLSCIVCGALTLSCTQQPTERAIQQDFKIEESIKKHLKEMSLEEKIGQMTQLNITEIRGENYQLDSAKADRVLRQYKVGSILNTPYGVADTPERYYQIIKQIQDISMEATGIPCIYGLDQIHGATYTKDATFFPQEVNIAATFNREHASNMGKVIAYETRASNVPWTFSPVMDLGRNPIWPRIWESFGEDVYVNSEMSVAELNGIQGEDPNHIGMNNVAACIKHYMAYGVPVSGQDRTPSSVTPSDMREKYFEPFKECIQAGALSLMVNSSNNNGMPFHCNYEYLTEWLKNDLNWDGMIVTDWFDIYNLHSRDHVASSKKEAVKLAINAGIDMAMVPMDTDFCDYLKELVEEGKVKMERINDAVARVLRLKYRLGLFEKPYWDTKSYKEFNSPETEQLAYQAAVESEVLLKNENNALPLKHNERILVTGPNANSLRTLNGGWSYSWQGDVAGDEEFSGKYNSIYKALKNKSDRINFVPGVSYDMQKGFKSEICNIPDAVTAAQNADVIIACIGENTYCETPGNDTDLSLSRNQIELVKALHKTGKKLILILNEGRPRIINEIEPLADAIVDIMLPSNHGGDALAALLYGEENFSGKLPFTYPKYINKWATYDYKPCEFIAKEMEGVYNYDAKMDVQWKFGDGLSYTEFEYSDLKVSTKEFNCNSVLDISIDVKNCGNVKGKESVLLYTSDMYASSTPDIRRLRDFKKIDLIPGEKKTIHFTLPATDLAFVNYYGKWTLEEGDFIITIGHLNEKIHCNETKIWDTPNID